MKRILPLLLLAAVLLTVLADCGRKGAPDGGLTYREQNAAPVFTAVRYELPDEYGLAEESRCAYDRETGNLTCPATRYVREADGTMRSDSALFTLSPDGKAVSKAPLPTAYVRLGFFIGDSFWYASTPSEEQRGGFSLCCADAKTGALLERIESAGLAELPEKAGLTVWTIDGEGAFWLADGGTVRVYSSDLRFLNTVQSPGAFSDLKTDADGLVWGCADFDGRGPEAARLDQATGTHSGGRLLERGARKLDFIDGYDFVWGGETGVCGMTEENGEPVAVVLLDYLTSGISVQEISLAAGIGSDTASFLQAVDCDTILFAETHAAEGGVTVTPVLCRRTEITDAAESVEIVLAHAKELDEKVRSGIVSFRKEHPNIKITLLDYSKYDTDDDPDKGKWMLTNDIVTGVCTPDLIYEPDSEIAERNVFLDLAPYLERDDEVNLDNVFGSVLRYFSCADGQIWGISPFFTMRSVFAPASTEGIPLDGEGWTVDEYLDFCGSLPEDVWPFGGYVTGWDSVFYAAGDSFYERDSGTTSFDSPTFIRLLEYHLAMPTVEEKRNIDILLDAGYSYGKSYFSLRPDAWKLGNVVMRDDLNVIQVESLADIFGTRDVVSVGYPGKSGNGASVSPTYPFAIHRNTKHPDEAWKVLKSFFHIREDGWAISLPGYSVLKSLFDEKMAAKMKTRTVHLENGGSFSVPRSETDEQIQADVIANYGGAGYTVEPVYESQIAMMRELLDTPGDRAVDFLPTEVGNIIFEEVLQLESSLGTPEECAKKIQSRASIWLAEH